MISTPVLYCSIRALNNVVASKNATHKSVDKENYYLSMVLLHEKENSLMEDKWKDKVQRNGAQQKAQ